MIDTKLILIEGLAGSGKSTTGQKLFKTIFDSGFDVEFFHEFRRPHPVIDPAVCECGECIDKILSDYIIFAGDLRQSDKIIILDGALYQNAVAECLERNIDESEIIDMVCKIYDIIAVADPVLVYLYQEDFERALRKTFNNRYESWQKKVTSFLSKAEYGRHKIQKGLALYIQYNRDLKNMSEVLFEKFAMRKIAVENSGGKWDEYLRRILRFMDLGCTNIKLRFDDYVGAYKDINDIDNLEIVEKNDSLVVHGLFPKPVRLHPKFEEVFFVEGKVQEIEFIRSEDGVIDRLFTKNFMDKSKNREWAKFHRMNEGK